MSQVLRQCINRLTLINSYVTTRFHFNASFCVQFLNAAHFPSLHYANQATRCISTSTSMFGKPQLKEKENVSVQSEKKTAEESKTPQDSSDHSLAYSASKNQTRELNVSSNATASAQQGDSQANPTPEQIDHVYNVLSNNLPRLFVLPLDYRIYHPNLIFENNIRGKRTEGLQNYIIQVSMLKIIGHLRFAYVTFQVVKITKNPEDNSVKVRWTIKGISGFKVLFQFWKYRLWRYYEIFDKCETWYDGFSTFYINGDGKVVKHVADKMMPDGDAVRQIKSTPIDSAKFALIVGILPRCSELTFS